MFGDALADERRDRREAALDDRENRDTFEDRPRHSFTCVAKGCHQYTEAEMGDEHPGFCVCGAALVPREVALRLTKLRHALEAERGFRIRAEEAEATAQERITAILAATVCQECGAGRGEEG